MAVDRLGTATAPSRNPAGPARLVAAVTTAPATDSRGRRLVATRACRKGEALLREAPLLIWGPDARADVIAAGGESLLASANALGSKGTDALAAFCALRNKSDATRTAVAELTGREANEVTDAMQALQKLPTRPPELMHDSAVQDCAALVGIIAANAAQNEDGRRALYGTLSMANHSCVPNAAWHTAEAGTGLKELVCIAPRIEEGEEVCISYLPERALFECGCEGRRQQLRDTRGFECFCTRCGGAAGEEEKGKVCDGAVNGGDGRLQELFSSLCKVGEGEAPTTKEEAVQICKDIGVRLRELDRLWPAASALKSSLWDAYARLLIRYGAPEQLKNGAACRALEESRPCLSPAAWVEQARLLQTVLQPSVPAVPAPEVVQAVESPQG